MNKIEIQYQTVLTNKNSLTEMNRQLLKIEIPHNQTRHNQTLTREQKNELRKFKENHESKKTALPSLRNLENSQDGNRKNESCINIYIHLLYNQIK